LGWPQLRGKLFQVLNAMRGSSVIRKNDELLLNDVRPEFGGWSSAADFKNALRSLCREIDPDDGKAFAKIFPLWKSTEYRKEAEGKLQAGHLSKAWIHRSIADCKNALENRYWVNSKDRVTVHLASA
jgi:hypothetical protein